MRLTNRKTHFTERIPLLSIRSIRTDRHMAYTDRYCAGVLDNPLQITPSGSGDENESLHGRSFPKEIEAWPGQKLFSLQIENWGVVYFLNYLSLSCKLRVTSDFSKSYTFYYINIVQFRLRDLLRPPKLFKQKWQQKFEVLRLYCYTTTYKIKNYKFVLGNIWIGNHLCR